MPIRSPAPTSNRSFAPVNSIARSRPTLAAARSSHDERRLPRPVSPRSMRAWAAGFRAVSSPSSSGRDRRAARACCCRRWRRPPRAASWSRSSIRSTPSTSSRRPRPAIDLDRLLWIRGHVVINPGLCRDLNQRALEQAIKALTLVLQAGNFGMRRARCGRRAAGGDRPAAVHDLAAAAAHHRKQSDRVCAGRDRADGSELGGADAEMRRATKAGKEPRAKRPGGKEADCAKARAMFKGSTWRSTCVSARGHMREGVRVAFTTQVSPYV